MKKNISKYFNPINVLSENLYIKNMEQYRSIYNKSINSPEKFWEEIADRISWYSKWDRTRKFDFVNGEIKWFEGATLNASYNCLDRHIENGYGEQKAIIWEGNNPSEDKSFTYCELLIHGCFCYLIYACSSSKKGKICAKSFRGHIF